MNERYDRSYYDEYEQKAKKYMDKFVKDLLHHTEHKFEVDQALKLYRRAIERVYRLSADADPYNKYLN